VGVELRIISPGGGLTERRHDQPERVGMQPPSVRPDASGGPVSLEVCQRR
jgi:hypothetical protein